MPATPPTGPSHEVLLVREQGGLTAVAQVGSEGERVVALTPSGRRVRLTRDRILFTPGRRIPGDGGDALLCERLRGYETEQAARAADIDLLSLWEVVQGEIAEIPVRELASLWTPGADGDAAGALLRAVALDGHRFRLKAESIEVRTADQVAEAQARREAAEREEQARRAMIAWIHDGGHDPPPAEAAHLLQALKDLAAAPVNPARGDPGVDLMEDAERDPSPRAAFQLLVDRGVFSRDENLYVHRYGLARPFPRAARDEADRVPPLPRDWPEGRIDLRGLAVLTLDDADTVEVDDGLSVEDLGGGRARVGVHIADPGAFVAAGSALDKEASKRATTVYLPERRFPMFPDQLGSGPFSLVAGQDRPAFSFLLTVDEDGELLAYEVARSVVRVARRLDYAGVDAGIDDDPALPRLRALGDALRARRRDAGALMTQLPEVSVKVDSEGNIRVKRFPARSPSREMVAEWMVWANHAAARWAWERRVPVPYRSQEPPDSPIPADLDPTDYVKVLLHTRKLGKTVVDRVPRRHYGLGIEGYVQVTSPIRRYLDLAAQRQLAASLAGQPPPLDPDGVKELARHVETLTGRAAIAEAGTREYFLLKWLGAKEGTVLRALVLEDQGDRYRVYLPDYALRVPYKGRRRFQVGEELWVEVQGAEPRAGRLRLREVERPASPPPLP